MKLNKTSVLQILILIGIGIIIGLLIKLPNGTAKPREQSRADKIEKSNQTESTMQSDSDRIENINQLLASEIDAREELQQKFAQLQIQLDAVITNESPSSNSPVERQQRVISTQQSRLAATQDRSWFNEAALLEVGIDETEAQRLKEIYEQNEMDRLYLRDKAIREGWLGKTRYVNEMEALNSKIANLKNDLDEDTYDAYLYASGKPNRVVINSTLSNSPAANAGLAPGDVILKYNEKRIYTAGELRDMTTQGEPNTLVSVEVIRNGKLITMYLPIGPLGIRMNSRSLAPGTNSN